MAFVHLMGMQQAEGEEEIVRKPWLFARKFFKGGILASGGFTKERGEEALLQGEVDLVAFGQLYIGNPDLVERFKKDAPLSSSNPNLYYAGGSEGYIDYEKLSG